MIKTNSNGAKPAALELREFKFIVQPVLIHFENGQVRGEQSADPITIYGVEALRGFCDAFADNLAAANEHLNTVYGQPPKLSAE